MKLGALEEHRSIIPATGEAEAEASQVEGQPGQVSESHGCIVSFTSQIIGAACFSPLTLLVLTIVLLK